MKPSELTFAALLSIEKDQNQWHYHIPRFQREYVWKKDNWSKLLEDIYENDSGHYMGAIICVNKVEDFAPGNELIADVIDGQQRLTTISLLLAAIFKKITELSAKDDLLNRNEDFIILRSGIKNRLIKEIKSSTAKQSWGLFKSGSLVYCLRVQPSTQGCNLIDYQYLLRTIGILPEFSYPKYYGNRRIYKTFEYLLNHIPDNYQELEQLLQKIYALSFVHISESSQSKAFMLFETLNDRGVPLSSIDIIKNNLLATLERKYSRKIEDEYEKWQKLLSFLPEDRDQDRFLRQFYNAFKIDPKIKIDRIPHATGSTIISIYEGLIKRDAELIFTELRNKAEIYNQFIEPEKYPITSLTSALIELERIGAAASYTFLLYLFSLPEDIFDEPEIKLKVVNLFCRYYFRRNVTDFPNTRDLATINIDLIEKCNQEIIAGRRISFPFIQEALLGGNGKPSFSQKFKESLSNSLFDINDYMARYALTILNQRYYTKEYSPNLWQRNEKGVYIWTVEHIFPQGESIPQCWIDMIADGDKEKAERIRSEKVHCLGNLTLSGYNSNLSNQSFEKKQSKSEVTVFGEKISIGYKNGLALNNIPFMVGDQQKTLASAEIWTEEYIISRNNVLVEMLLKQFAFEGE